MPTAPLDSLEACVNTARVRLNDAIQSLSGDILTDTAVFTITSINGAWRRLQELLVNFGVAWLKQDIVLSGVPATTNTDAGSQVYFNWANYFDGTGLQAAPILPQDLIAPLLLQERAHGGTGMFFPMDRLDNGLPAIPKGAFNKSWEWRQGAIYMPGATQITDVRLRYAAFFADFVAAATTAFSAQPIPIVRALNSLAWFICSEVAKARGDMDAGPFDEQAQLTAQYIFNLEPMQARSIGNEAEYGKMPDKFTPPAGPAGPRGKDS